MNKGIGLSLALPFLMACGNGDAGPTGPPGNETGSIEVSLAVTGGLLDVDGCHISVDDGSQRTLQDGESHTFEGVNTGDHVVTISDVAPSCAVEGESWQSVTVRRNQSSTVEFSVTCPMPVRDRIAFTSERDGNLEIYLMDSDGSNPVNLTNHPMHDSDPAWSPDGTRIAFSGSRDSIHGIYMMDADGHNVRLVIENGWWPTWSPHGDRIAYDRLDGIYVVNVDGSNPTPLLDYPALYHAEPAWSPNGQWIAFTGFDGTASDIYVVGANGGAPINLTNDATGDDEPAWSPDGMRIAYQAVCGGVYEIFSVQVDGTGLTQLTDTDTDDFEPAWSPVP